LESNVAGLISKPGHRTFTGNQVSIYTRQSRRLQDFGRSERLDGVADAAPGIASRSKRLSGALMRPRIHSATEVPVSARGWFAKVGRGTFDVSPAGRSALEQYADVIAVRSVTGAAG
jgi:hypothetical protein